MIPTLVGFRGGLVAPPPPVMDHHTAAGQFAIIGYNSSLVYTPTLISGSGTPTFNAVSGVFTLPVATSRFSVQTSYAVGAPRSSSGFMERRAYESTLVTTYEDICADAYLWPDGNCPGPNCCNAYNSCWGTGVDGTCASDGTTCCGGSRGQRTIETNVKNPTPETYIDSYGEWWRIT